MRLEAAVFYIVTGLGLWVPDSVTSGDSLGVRIRRTLFNYFLPHLSHVCGKSAFPTSDTRTIDRRVQQLTCRDRPKFHVLIRMAIPRPCRLTGLQLMKVS